MFWGLSLAVFVAAVCDVVVLGDGVFPIALVASTSVIVAATAVVTVVLAFVISSTLVLALPCEICNRNLTSAIKSFSHT
ncbi:Hypothetical predicted protein [Octopus vulgaris]|uniref:Uncharacterized protein n=1 Tax=Octopus vulgaris TaxID=6645 RepID=A0AA36AQR9_OCTVU|nr:Hypothetical predicted protein [Octopus vulgaris]